MKKGAMVQRLIIKLIHFLIIHSAMALSTKQGLILLFSLNKIISNLINLFAINYESGIHPKHRLTHYHEFFCRHVLKVDHVLDFGCGNGYLAYQVAIRTGASVFGIDKNPEMIRYAANHFFAPNLRYYLGDFTTDVDLQPIKTDTIILSNVLEHFENRIELLKRLRELYDPRCFLIRVPAFERSWEVPFMMELGIDHRSDDTHFIEYERGLLLQEVSIAGLEIIKTEVKWGEIYLVAVTQ